MKAFAPRSADAPASAILSGKAVAPVDNRPAAVAQRQLQTTIAASLRQAAPVQLAAPRRNTTGLPDQLIKVKQLIAKNLVITSSTTQLMLQEGEKDPNNVTVADGIAAAEELRALLSKMSNAETAAKAFAKAGGVGRHLTPPGEALELGKELIQNESQILAWLDKIKISGAKSSGEHNKNIIYRAVGKCMTYVNLTTDVINKAESNARAWTLDGNGSETDGVEPSRKYAIILNPIWNAASEIHTEKKRGYLVAADTKRRTTVDKKRYSIFKA